MGTAVGHNGSGFTVDNHKEKTMNKLESTLNSRRFKLAVASAICVFFSEYLGIEITDDLKAQLLTAISGFWAMGDSVRKTE